MRGVAAAPHCVVLPCWWIGSKGQCPPVSPVCGCLRAVSCAVCAAAGSAPCAAALMPPLPRLQQCRGRSLLCCCRFESRGAAVASLVADA